MTNKIVVVTGASAGIGFAIASHLHKEGHTVYGVSRSYPKQKYDFKYFLCDITNQEMIDQLIQSLAKEQTGIDVLVNCAGMGISGSIEETSEKQYDKIFAVNVKGMFLLTKSLLPLLRKGSKAKIINIGSVAGELFIPFQGFYSMTKASVGAFSEALRLELKPFGIDVSTILPGDTKTDFTANREKNLETKTSLYKERAGRSVARMEHDEQTGKSPFTVAKAVSKLIKKKSMPISYTIGFQYKLFLFLKRIFPKRMVSWVVYLMYGK